MGRFPCIDPPAERFAWVNPYNYAENEPVGHVDLWGLQAVFAGEGRLVGYIVQKGQGPTQIAQDLNQNYSCYLSCEVDYIVIVEANLEKFENVVDANGNIKDKSSAEYKSGNIQAGDYLSIPGGKHDEKYIKRVEEKIHALEQKIDSLEDAMREEDRKAELEEEADLYEPEPGDPGEGIQLAKGVNIFLRERRQKKRLQRIEELKIERDKLEQSIEAGGG